MSRKASIYISVLLIITMSVPVTYGREPESAKPVQGSWTNRQGLSYVFGDDGVMLKTAGGDATETSERFDYEIVAIGTHNLIRYGRDLSDDSAPHFLMAADMTDTTATFAHGLVFVRADSSRGLKGEWMHVDELAMIRWYIDSKMVSYRHEKLDLKTGAFAALEERTGTYRRGHHMDDAGRLYINFDDGTDATVFPLLFHDVMYLFDFSEIRSSFSRTAPLPDQDKINEAKK